MPSRSEVNRAGKRNNEERIVYRMSNTHHDAASKFIRITTRGLRNSILPEDLIPLVQDVVETHPGLTFLKEATEFHSRYVHTVRTPRTRELLINICRLPRREPGRERERKKNSICGLHNRRELFNDDRH